MSYYTQENYKGAIGDLTTAIRLKPDFAQAYAERGQTLAQLGNYKGAREDLQKAAGLYQQNNIEQYKIVQKKLSELQQ